MRIHLLRITLKICPVSRDPFSESYLNEDFKLIVPNVRSDRPPWLSTGVCVGFMVFPNLMINQCQALYLESSVLHSPFISEWLLCMQSAFVLQISQSMQAHFMIASSKVERLTGWWSGEWLTRVPVTCEAVTGVLHLTSLHRSFYFCSFPLSFSAFLPFMLPSNNSQIRLKLQKAAHSIVLKRRDSGVWL